MFKRNKFILATLLVAFVFLFAGEWSWKLVTWNSGSVSSTGLLTTEADTTDVFNLTKKIKGRLHYPETLSFLLWATESTYTDSTNVAFALDLSNDQTYWHSYGTLVTLTSTVDASAETTVDDTIVTDMALFQYGRIRATLALPVGDTLSVGVQITMDYSNY